MNNTKILSAVLAFTFVIASVDISNAQKTEPKIKITDTKLHSINYGIDSLEYWVEKAKTGDSKRAATLTRDLEKLEVRFKRLPNSDSGQYKYVANRIVAMRNSIEKKSESLEEDQETLTSQSANKESTERSHPDLINLSRMLGNLEFDVERYKDNHKQRSRMRSDLETAAKRFGRIPKSNHSDYLAVQKQIENLKAALQPAGGDLQMDKKQVAAYVESIRVKYSQEVLLPEARDIMKTRELSAEDVDGIVAKLKAFGENADQDLPKLRQVVEATGQGAYWLKWLEKDSIEKLKRNMASIKKAIDNRVGSGLRNAKQRSELDPEKNRYSFATESVRTQHEADHGRTMRTLKQASRLEQLLEMPQVWTPKIEEMESYVAQYKAKAQAASTVRELPTDVGTNETETIAKDVFKVEKYGVGEVVRLVVNSKPVPRDRIEHKASNGKLETIVREWTEFQVTTVERENGKLFVYVNNLANFSRAPGTTPVNQWIMKQRFKRGEISNEDSAK